jgi:hypothetical protein
MSARSSTFQSARGHRVGLGFFVTLLLVVFPATSWGNATVSESACPAPLAGTCLFYAGTDGEFDAYDLQFGASYTFAPVHLNDDPAQPLGVAIDPGAGCLAGVAGSVTCSTPVAALVINAQGGDDWLVKQLTCGCLPVFADMGDGNDQVLGSKFADALSGGAGNDVIGGHDGNDRLDGGPGDDAIDPGAGADEVIGGPGTDIVSYFKGPAQPVAVTLDDVANDGEFGELDNIHSDVENINGGDGADVLVGSAQTNVIHGDLNGDLSSGNDVIDGGAGADSLFGDGGNDTLRAFDGVRDVVDCGAGTDVAFVDPIDTVSGCETVSFTAGPQPGGGGAGGGNGNGANNRVASRLSFRLNPFSRFTTVSRLTVLNAEVGAITMKCTGRGCPFKTKRVNVAKPVPKQSLLKYFNFTRKIGKGPRRKRFVSKLRVGTKLEIDLSSAGKVGTYTVFTMRKRKAPSRVSGCLAAGGTKKTACG